MPQSSRSPRRKTTIVSVSLPNHLVHGVRQQAFAEHRSISSMVAVALTHYLHAVQQFSPSARDEDISA